MLFQLTRPERLAAYAARLSRVHEPNDAIFFDLLDMPGRAAVARQDHAIASFQKLVRCEAWTEASLASLELFAPRWSLSRLVYDGGEWHCCISSQRDVPDWINQTIETHHADLCLSILTAAVEAMRNDAINRAALHPAPVRSIPEALVLCEDFF